MNDEPSQWRGPLPFRTWVWAGGVGGLFGGFYQFQGALADWSGVVLVGAAVAGIAFLALSSRWVRLLTAPPHLRAAGFAAFWIASSAGGWAITLLVWFLGSTALVLWPYFVFQVAVFVFPLAAWLRIRRRLRVLSISGGSRSATWLWLVGIGHGIGWIGVVALGPWPARPHRGTLLHAVDCVTSVILPWTVAPLLPLAAWSLRGALRSREARRWALACTTAVALGFGRQVVSLAFPTAAMGPATAWKWQGLGMHCSVVAGLAISFVVLVRAWHDGLDEEFDEHASVAEIPTPAGVSDGANPVDPERR